MHKYLLTLLSTTLLSMLAFCTVSLLGSDGPGPGDDVHDWIEQKIKKQGYTSETFNQIKRALNEDFPGIVEHVKKVFNSKNKNDIQSKK